MAEPRKHLPHLRLTRQTQPDKYVSPFTGRTPAPPNRNRVRHAQHLLSQLGAASAAAEELGQFPQYEGEDCVRLEFESEPDFDLATKSLDLQSQGISLLSVREENRRVFAVVRLPRTKLSVLVGRINAYRDEVTKKGEPKNRALVDTISNIRVAHISSLWTDDRALFPLVNEELWWEVWLEDEEESSVETLGALMSLDGARVSSHHIKVLDRTVLLVFASFEAMQRIVETVGAIAELRRAKILASEFRKLSSIEQGEWVRAALGLVSMPGSAAPAVCILDTGVNRAHQLLNGALAAGDLHAIENHWGTDDHEGHGTEMAGLALYGNLTEVLLRTTPIQLTHCLESVKILPPGGANPPELYGAITIEAITLASNAALHRDRNICLAVTTTDFRDRGRPSSWSAVVDQLCFGTDQTKPILIAISAGNTPARVDFPAGNFTAQVHDPGQAWNALTVGAYTEKAIINEPAYLEYAPLAGIGDMCPTTTTSVTWPNDTPIKPEIVMEGGNWAAHPAGDVASPDSLALLTTHYVPAVAQFSCISDTSAAVAQASHLAAGIQATYGWAWPETVRGLMIHAARWSTAMVARVPASVPRRLRTFGYGAVNKERAMWSAQNALTLIIQDELQPFEKDSMKELKIHELAWPKAELEALGAEQVEMRVTLSYFIEPNPARRGWTNKHRYRSHGLRFATIKSTESLDDFQKRINVARRGEDDVDASATEPGWLLGEKLRTKGSVHSDIWKGTAVDLANRSQIAIFPVVGWWRDRPSLKRYLKRVRYSLIVSIEARQDIDIYTTVENQISILT